MVVGRTVKRIRRLADLYIPRRPTPAQEAYHNLAHGEAVADSSVASVSKTFADFHSVDELNKVNDAQKTQFAALVASSGGELWEQRCAAYLTRWREALVHIGDNAKLLDIGGGYPIDRIWDEVIGRHHIEYHMLDIEFALINRAKEILPRYGLPPGNAVVGANTELPYDDASFDVVFSSHCLEHSPRLDRTFEEIARVLRPNGRLIFAVPFGFDDSDEHLICLDIDGWIRCAEWSGFDVVNYHIGATYPMGGWDLFVVATRNPERRNMPAFRSMAERFTKAGRTFVRPTGSEFRYAGRVTEHDPYRMLSERGARATITHPRGVDVILFLAQPVYGVVAITAGPFRLYCDCYSHAPYVLPVALPPGTRAVEVEVMGNSGGPEQAGLFGALLAR